MSGTSPSGLRRSSSPSPRSSSAADDAADPSFTPKRGRGRPPKLSKQIIEDICKLVRAGVPVKTAALATGISESSYYAWKASAESGRAGNYALFLRSILKAHASAQARLVVKISTAAETDWKAGRYLLQVIDPKTYVVETRDTGAPTDPAAPPITFFIPAEVSPESGAPASPTATTTNNTTEDDDDDSDDGNTRDSNSGGSTDPKPNDGGEDRGRDRAARRRSAGGEDHDPPPVPGHGGRGGGDAGGGGRSTRPRRFRRG